MSEREREREREKQMKAQFDNIILSVFYRKTITSGNQCDVGKRIRTMTILSFFFFSSREPSRSGKPVTRDGLIQVSVLCNF